MSRAHRDPTGLTAAAARREVELLFTKHPLLASIYGHDTMEAASPVVCRGQACYAGRKKTNGCGHAHLQPCPGGPLIYTIRRHTSMGFTCIESSGASWREAIDKILMRREAEHSAAAAIRAQRKRR